MSRSLLAFTAEGDDPLFLETVANLHDSSLTLEVLEAVWKSAFEHFECMAEFCPDFAEKFEAKDQIDIAQPGASFYNVALVRIGWKGTLPAKLAEMAHRLYMDKMSQPEVLAWNAFINAMIVAQKADLLKRRNAF